MRAVIVLPTYNERENITTFLRAVREVPLGADDVLDVLIVDDSSPDGTADVARQAAAEFDAAPDHNRGTTAVLVRPGKQGLGSAYRQGFAQVLDDAAYEVVISMDADLSHDPQVIPTMLAALAEGADLVVGSRYVRGGGTTDWPVRRQLLSKWGNTYTRLVLGLDTHDCTSGYRAYRAPALAAVEPASTAAEGYAFLTELVRRLTRQGYKVVETPIVFRDRTAGRSKMSGRIIAESMLLVTRWGLRDLFTGRRRGR
ncbi:MAG TPA: polyprenol monophosphomannose synthase [Ilumatobacter sp.]|nr:polyprenol monophosphomannose synthase [Ilumatobacter sp.]